MIRIEVVAPASPVMKDRCLIEIQFRDGKYKFDLIDIFLNNGYQELDLFATYTTF